MIDKNKEKKAEVIIDALDYIDDDMLESVDSLRKRSLVSTENKKGIRKGFFQNSRVLAVAASVCLLVLGAYAWDNMIGPLGEMHDTPPGAGNMAGHATENAPGWQDEEMEDMTEGDVSPAPDTDAWTDGKGEENNDIWQEPIVPGESDCTDTLPEDSQLKETEIDTDTSAEVRPPEVVEPGEPDFYPPLGDAYQLKDNYVKVTMLPHKAWDSEASLEENLAKSREIEEKYYQKIDAFVEALCTTPLIETEMALGGCDLTGNTDMYYLFFQRTDGKIVQVSILGDNGLVYFYDKQEYCMKIDGEILYEVRKVLWMKW